MNYGTASGVSDIFPPSPEIIDLLPAAPCTIPFTARVRNLALSAALETKILTGTCQLQTTRNNHSKSRQLTPDDERELATEVLRYRHLFTELLLQSPRFRQAALTVIQNIYLFRNRKIFFGTIMDSAEFERQEALALFSTHPCPSSLPLTKTLQHLVIARIWSRIISQSTTNGHEGQGLSTLLEVVNKLNTLRNVYVLLTTGLVKKLVIRTNPLYSQSITYEDAVQIGSIGIARAAYRYHPSYGVRFSTFAAHWVYREIQRQSLGCRLIRISANTVLGYTKALREENKESLKRFSAILESATSIDENLCGDVATLPPFEPAPSAANPVGIFETLQLRQILLQTIDRVLSPKAGDILKRRFGLPPYRGEEQSIIAISETYQVTRSSIYQTQQLALKKLQSHLLQARLAEPHADVRL